MSIVLAPVLACLAVGAAADAGGLAAARWRELADRNLIGVPAGGYDACTVDPTAADWLSEPDVTTIRHHANGPEINTVPYGNFTDGHGCVPGDSEDDVFCPATPQRWTLCERAGGSICTARVTRQSIATGAVLGSTFVDVCVPGTCVGSADENATCLQHKGTSCPNTEQRAEMLKRRMCRNPNEFCDVSYLCVGRTGPCSALTYHKLKLTEMSQCECEGCAKAVIQGGAVSTDTASEAMGMLAQFMERNDFICNKPDEYKDACKEVDGYMCTLRVEALIVNTVTGLQSTRGGSIDTCLRNSCAHCYNRRPWDPHSGCGESIASLHFMRADNRHLRNALLEMFGNEEMSDVLITKLEYRCSTKSYVDVGSIVGGSTAGSVMAMLLLVVFLLVVKRKVRDETRAVMLLGKSEEEKNKLLDEWGIGYKAKRAKEIAKATKAHKKELKRKENELKAAQKAAAKRKRKHDRLVEKVNKKHQKKGLLSIGGKR
jgi:hypothetical protein